MATVLIDVDETLADITTPWLIALGAHYGIHITKDQLTNYYLGHHYGASLAEVLAIAAEHRVLENAKPLPLVRAALHVLESHGHNVVLITSRGWHTNAFPLTKKWCLSEDLPYNQLCVLPITESKATYARQHLIRGREPVYFLDDHAGNLAQFKRHVPLVKRMLIDQPWNQAATEHRVRGVHSALPFIL